MNGIILFMALAFCLWLGRSIFIPLLVATFLWYLINAIASYYRLVFPYPDDTTWRGRIFDCLANILSIGTLVGIGYIFATQIRPMFSEFVGILPELQNKIMAFGDYLSVKMGVPFDSKLIPNISQIAASVGASLAGVVASTGMVLVYMLFMFVEQSTFNKKFASLVPNKTKFRKVSYIVESIDENMKKYLFVKTMISGITGVLSFFWLQIIGVEFAGVWAFIVFVTSFIPTIGAFVACGLPILYSLVMAPSLQQPFLTAIGLIGLQIVFGNILEPKLTGQTLNLSTLAILINLVFWGMIWGVAGMFFSFPLLVAVFIITAQFDSTRWVAVLLSADGAIPDKRN